jgi:hypothetical protein
MADDEQDALWKEFEELGVEEVHRRLGVWSESKARRARQWLQLQETSLAREANDLAKKANDAAKEANDIARTNNIIATLALVGAGFSITISIIGLFLSMFLKKG